MSITTTAVFSFRDIGASPYPGSGGVPGGSVVVVDFERPVGAVRARGDRDLVRAGAGVHDPRLVGALVQVELIDLLAAGQVGDRGRRAGAEQHERAGPLVAHAVEDLPAAAADLERDRLLAAE